VEELLDSGDPETVLKAVSALSTASGVYLKCSEAHDFERRLEAFQRELDEVRATVSRPTGTTPRPQAAIN
jgi:hypothetical protein